ncbi:MAG: hypothetical protein GTO14_13315 [Anaerolineales bacterium]|nr:hypothetical protein [Anaerolineales bacterium]
MSCGDRLAKELRRKGFRVTPQRTVILETVAHKGGHLSVQEVYAQSQQRLPGLNIATVYRTLDSLHRAGMVNLFNSGSSPSRFSLRDPLHPHGHLVCEKCEDIIDIDPDLIDHLVQAVEVKTGFAIDSHHLTLVGLCEECKSTEIAG